MESCGQTPQTSEYLQKRSMQTCRLERWQSGRMRVFAKDVTGQKLVHGFESRPLRFFAAQGGGFPSGHELLGCSGREASRGPHGIAAAK
jgi:hypothetical protein